MQPIAAQQPEWVCDDCGREWGRWYDNNSYFGPAKHCATYHVNRCEVCNQEKPVTEARDYGFLRKGWKKIQAGISCQCIDTR